MEVQKQAVEVLTSKLPADTLQRVVDILSKLHLSGQEPALLSFLPVALLSSATRSPSFASPIFRAPLDTCEFNAHHVETDWRAQHQTALLPQFADTLSSSQSQNVSVNSSQRNTRGPIQLLATQATTLEFQPTQTGSSLPPSLASSLLALPNPSTVTSNQLQDGTAPNLGRLQVLVPLYCKVQVLALSLRLANVSTKQMTKVVMFKLGSLPSALQGKKSQRN